MNLSESLRRNLFDLKDIQARLPVTAPVEMGEGDPETGITRGTMRFPLEVRGVKSLTVVLSLAIHNDKAFIANIDFRASATIGTERFRLIESMISDLFSPSLIPVDQPEGLYIANINYRATYRFCERINSSDLVPLYIRKEQLYQRTEDVSGFEYKGRIVEQREYGNDFIDEKDKKYSVVRTITAREKEYGYLYVVADRYRFYVSLADFPNDGFTVLDPRLNVKPPVYGEGTVLFDRDNNVTCLVQMIDGQLQLMRENYVGVDPWGPEKFMSDQYEVWNQPFAMENTRFYFHRTNRGFVQATEERAKFVVVRKPDGSNFQSRSSRDEPKRLNAIPKHELTDVPQDIPALYENGKSLIETSVSAALLAEMIRRLRVVYSDSSSFDVAVMVGFAVRKHGTAEQACYDLYCNQTSQFDQRLNEETLEPYWRALFEEEGE